MEFKELEIIKSKDLTKKYTAVIQEIGGSRSKYFVDFGDINKPHFRDSTKLKLYSRMDDSNGNGNTKENFYNEIKKRNLKIKKFTPLYFMSKYLYS